MKLAPWIWISLALAAVSAALGLWAYAALPADARIAVHFGLSGQADRYAPKAFGLVLMPLVGLAVLAGMAVMPRLSRRREGLAASSEAYGFVLSGVQAVMLAAQGALVARALDPRIDVVRWLFVAVGLLFALTGNYLGKVRHNDIFGVRTPWTLMDPRVWDKTHRFTGRLMFVAGVALTAGALAGPGRLALACLMIACAAIPGLAGVAYSWAISNRQPVGR